MDQQTVSVELYTRRDGVVRGPYTSTQITRYLLLGRIRLDDELSRDRKDWSPADSFATLIPYEIVSLESWEDYRRLVEARLRADERKGERRCRDCPDYVKCRGDRRAGSDRRITGAGSPDAGTRDAILPARSTGNHQASLLRTLLLSLLLATLVFAWLVPAGR